MSLGIFSFDLAAIINSLSNFIDNPEQFADEPINSNPSLDVTADILQNTTAAESVIDDILMATALNNVVTSVILQTENIKKESANTKNSMPKPAIRIPSITLDDETKREIEQLIRTLQTSVIHNYQSSDIIDETVSLNNVANFPKKEIPTEPENNTDKIQEEKKRAENKLQLLRDELKKAMLKNSSEV
jgi:hypothetical protein